MFTIDPNITDLRVKERVISKAFFSMNSPEIATPELSVEEARCYIFLFREGNAYTAYIALFLPNSERRYYYASSDNPVAEEKVSEVLEEATRFAEQMGFLLDELNLSTVSVDERNRWIEDQPIFFGLKKKADKKAEVGPAEMQPAKPNDKKAPPSDTARQHKPPPSSPDQAAMTPLPLEDPLSAASLEMEAEESASLKPKKPVEAKAPAAQKQAAPPAAAAAPVQRGATGPGPAAARPAEEKQQKPAAKKQAQSSTGTVNREYEALARLLASF